MKKQNCFKTAGYIAVLSGLSIAPALAQTSATEGSVEVFGGIAQDERPLGSSKDRLSAGLLPSINFALGDAAVIQADGLIASHRKDRKLGGAVHLAYTLGDAGVVGLYGSYVDSNELTGLSTWRLGAEAVTTIGPVTLSGVAGYEDSSTGATVVGVTTTDTISDVYGHGGSFFDMIDIRYQATEKASLSVGHRYIGKAHAAAAGVNFNASQRITLFGEGRLGEGDYNAVWVGIRIRFGGNSEDGAATRLLDNRLKDDMFGSGNTRQRVSTPLPPPPPPPPTGGTGGYAQ